MAQLLTDNDIFGPKPSPVRLLSDEDVFGDEAPERRGPGILERVGSFFSRMIPPASEQPESFPEAYENTRRRFSLRGPRREPEPPDPELEKFYGETTMGERVLNPLRAGVEQFGQSRAGQTADLAARNLRDLEAMRSGKVGGSMARAVQMLSEDEYQAARQARLAPLDEATREIVTRQREIESVPVNPATRGTLQADTFAKAVEQWWRDPLAVIRDIGLQSLPASAPGMIAGTAGAVAGGPVMGASLMGLGSAGTEYVSAVVDGLREKGIDTRDPEAVKAAFSNPAVMADIRSRAATRSSIIGLADAATFGIASKTLAPRAVTGPLARQAVNVPTQMGVQAAGGAGGEAAAQLATGEWQPGQIVAEAMGEMVTAPADVGALALSARARPRLLTDAEVFGNPAPARSAPPAATGPQPVPPGALRGETVTPPQAQDIAVTPRGREVGVAYQLVEASDLVASHGPDLVANPRFPAELQPRDRTRAASAEQVQDIAANLDPRRLGRSNDVTTGAPLVGPDGIVESGNARTLAIRRAYDQGLPGAQAYRDFLTRQGYDVSGLKQPVLVRRRTTQLSPEDRLAFVRESNERTAAAMSQSEVAMADAKALSDSVIESYQGGDITSAANRNFVRAYLDSVVAPSERAALYTREGGLSIEGAQRIANALFARAYEDPNLLASLREDADSNFKAIGNAMTDAAGDWMRMRADAARGAIPRGLDPTAALKEALSLVRRARGSGQKIADVVNQRDLVSGSASPEAIGFLRLMFRDEAFAKPVSRERLAGSLRYVADQARKAQGGPGLFGNQQPVTVNDLLRLARQRSEGGLFDVMDATAKQERPTDGVLPEMSKAAPPVNDNTIAQADEKLRKEIRDFIESDPATKAFNQQMADAAADGAIFARGWGITGENDVTQIVNEDHAPVAEIKKIKGGYSLNVLGNMIPQRFGSYAEVVHWVLGTDEARGMMRAQAGANYTGFVKDQVTGTPARNPLRREKILGDLRKALGISFYEGRVQSQAGHNALGFYRRFIEEVRLKKRNDIEVASHEVAHLLDDRIPEIRAQWFPASNANATIRAELSGVSYDKKKLYEGFAEFARLWMTQPTEAQAKAPTFHAWWEAFLNRHPYGPAIRKAKADMLAWYGQDAIARARSKIGTEEAIKTAINSVTDRFRQATFDDLHGILNAERTLKGGIEPVGSYVTSRLTRGKFAVVEGALLYGAPVVQGDGSTKFEGKSLKNILDPISERLDDWLMYAVGRSANELMQQNRERLFTKAEIQGMLALETPEFKKAFEEYGEWNKRILDFAERKGLINAAQRASWRRTQYVPFHRVGQNMGGTSGTVGDFKGIKALTGGDENIRPVLSNILGNATMLISAAIDNEARQKIAALTGMRGSARFLTKIPTESKWVQVHRAEIERQILRALGVTDKRHLPPDIQSVLDQIVDAMDVFVPLEIKGQAPRGPNIFAALHQGKPLYYEVADPLLMRSIMRINRPIQEGVLKWINMVRGVGQTTVTLTPEFMLRNLARDTLMGSIMSQHGFKPLLDSLRGMKSRIAVDENYKTFLANGGGLSSHVVDEEVYRRRLEHFYSSKGINYQTVLDSPRKLIDGMRTVAEAFEMSTRLGEFRQAIQRGEDPRQAAYAAREVSTDFAMRGDNATIGFLYDSIIFFKAAMNGLDRLYRGLAHDNNRGAVAAKAGLFALTAMALYSINRGNELYDDLPDWDKDSHLHFFIPTLASIRAYHEGKPLPPLEQRYHHLRLPTIWEIGALASISARALERFLDGKPKEFAKDVLRIFGDTFSFGGLPQVIAPIYEQAANKIGFINRPIEPQGLEDLPAWARATPGTSRTLAWLGENVTRHLPRPVQEHGLVGFPLSPARIEALLRGYFNSFAAYGLSIMDAVFVDDRPDARPEDYPVIGRVIGSFYRTEPMRGTKYETQFYDALREATEVRRAMRQMDRVQRPEIADEMQNTPENILYGQLTRANRTVQAINREVRTIHQARTLPQLREMAEQRDKIPGFGGSAERARKSGAWNTASGLKRHLLDEATRERNLHLKQTMREYDEQRKQLEPGRASR